MLIFQLAAAALFAAPGPVTLPGVATRAGCQPDLAYVTSRPGERLSPRKLSELPAGKAFYSMVHTVDGCPAPVLAGQRRSR